MKSLMVCSVVLCGHVLLAGRASFKVMALDSGTGQPIPNVKIEGSFLNYSPGWNIAAKNNDMDAWTDRNGVARLSGNTEKGVCGYRIYRTPGYYNAEWVEIAFSEQSFLKLGRWLPDDIVVTARLDRVINPIPLFVKKNIGAYRRRSRGDYVIDTTYKEMPTALSLTNSIHSVSNATMAFDMVMGEWLPPIGKGNVADVSFRFNEDVLGWKVVEGYSVTVHKMYKMNALISISGNGNGMVEIVPGQNVGIKLRTAPLEGYEQNCSRWRGWFGGGDGDKTDCDKSRCYAFRIRTVYDENGNIKSAYYGKIYDDFDLSGLDGVRFLYYLNPTPNDRNLEWDMKNNLCPKPGDIGNPRP